VQNYKKILNINILCFSHQNSKQLNNKKTLRINIVLLPKPGMNVKTALNSDVSAPFQFGCANVKILF
jgi:hypothetical protein